MIIGVFCVVAYCILAIFVVDLIYKIIYPIYPYFLIAIGIKRNLKKLAGAEWAVITGATDGVGKSYGKALAKKGFNILLISRTPSKLQDTAAEFEKEFPNVETRILAFDFTTCTEPKAFDAIKEAISSIDIGVLINNVGVSYGCIALFDQVSEQKIRDVVNVNCLGTTLMTHFVLPQMKKRGKGVIVNVASVTGLTPVPFLATYSATKAYLGHLTDCLKYEYSPHGITFQCSFPFFISTKMSGAKTSSFFVPDPETYVATAINTIGLQTRTLGCFSHALKILALRFFPHSLSIPIAVKILNFTKTRWSSKGKTAKQPVPKLENVCGS